MIRNQLAPAAVLLAALACLVVRARAGDSPGDVRPLMIDCLELPPQLLGSGGGPKVFKSREEVEKAAGKTVAAVLANYVDFSKENVVFVRWETFGPPFGQLKYEITGKGKDRHVRFYVQEPPGNGPRGRAARLGADFFAIPRDVTVKTMLGRL
jgi:hypothetical protein